MSEMNKNSRLLKIIILFLVTIIMTISTNAKDQIKNVSFSVSENGWIPVWLTAGPFKYKLDNTELSRLNPKEGDLLASDIIEEKQCRWLPQSIDEDHFLDFNSTLAWNLPGKIPEEIHPIKEGYAAAYLESEKALDVNLLIGANSKMRVYLNSNEIYSFSQEKDAIPDDDTVRVQLKKGLNTIVIGVINTPRNLMEKAFWGIPWRWGAYVKILDTENKLLSNIKVILPVKSIQTDFDIESTMFFKKAPQKLNQRFDIVINSRFRDLCEGELLINIGKKQFKYRIDSIPFGISRRSIYLPEVEKYTEADCQLKIKSDIYKKSVVLRKRKHYELHLMILTHMDIGYTNPQPVVKERHIQTLNDVLVMCENDPDFKWTIETTWLLEQYELSVSKKRFNQLMDFIEVGRISLSPIYSNPFTGWVSVEEILRSFDKMKEYADRYGIEFSAAIYNDLPGASWILPQVLTKCGTKFCAFGINEIYQQYTLQSNLPKVFYWEGADDSKMVTYITEAYVEGRSLGLEQNINCIETRLWNRLNKLEEWDYPYEMVLINAAYNDNSGIPKRQYDTAKKWNQNYEYPKIIISNLNEFSEEFINRYKNKIPTIKGDWTSDWDILSQSEPKQFIKHRLVQKKLLDAEKLSTINWLADSINLPLAKNISEAYKSILNFSGHGSGLEYGFGSPEDNALTMAYRENYLDAANLETEAVIRRSFYRLFRSNFGFGNESVIVFNTLSWQRDAVAEVNFKIQNINNYQIVDATTDEVIPGYCDGHKLRFIARNLPSLGYKIYKLKKLDNAGDITENDLKFSDNSLENEFYRIIFDPKSGNILKIVDKKFHIDFVDGKNNFKFLEPVRERRSIGEKYCSFQQEVIKVSVIDEHPIRLLLKINRDNQLFEETNLILWSGIDRIDISQTIDMTKLQETDILEEYGLQFPVSIDSQEERVEIIGGYLNPDKDRFPGINHDAFSIRRSVAIYNDNNCVNWATADSRVINIRKDGDNTCLISNIVNNFPKNWNRNQDNSGKMISRYSLNFQDDGFNPAFTSRSGWEFWTEAIAFHTWLNINDTEKSYFSCDNENIIILTIKPSDDYNKWCIDLINVNPNKTEKAAIKSEFFTGQHAYYANIMWKKEKSIAIRKNSFNVMLKPNEIITVMIEKEK